MTDSGVRFEAKKSIRVWETVFALVWLLIVLVIAAIAGFTAGYVSYMCLLEDPIFAVTLGSVAFLMILGLGCWSAADRLCFTL